MEWLWIILLFFLGSALGSFCHLVGIRLPLKKPIVQGRSSCVHCAQTLSLWQLIPVISWLCLGGRCHACRQRISILYPLSEIVAGFLFIVPLWQSAQQLELWIWYPLVLLFMILTSSDLHYRLLPNRIVLPGMLVFSLIRVWVHPLPLWEYAGGFIVGGGVLLLVSYVSARFGRPAMGGGDIKLMALCGLVLGIKLVCLTIFLSAMLGSIVGLALIWGGKMKRQTFLPFGPFIAIAAMVSFWLGDAWIAWYMQLWDLPV